MSGSAGRRGPGQAAPAGLADKTAAPSLHLSFHHSDAGGGSSCTHAARGNIKGYHASFFARSPYRTTALPP